MLATILTVTIIVLGLLLAWKQTNVARQRRWPWRWARWAEWGLAVMGLYWAGLYIAIYLNIPGFSDPNSFGPAWVRPALAITLAVLLLIADGREAR